MFQNKFFWPTTWSYFLAWATNQKEKSEFFTEKIRIWKYNLCYSKINSVKVVVIYSFIVTQ